MVEISANQEPPFASKLYSLASDNYRHCSNYDVSQYKSANKARTTPVVDKARTTPVVDKARTTPVVDKARITPVVDKARTTPVVDKARTTPVVDNNRQNRIRYVHM